jgi:hypothetical protein
MMVVGNAQQPPNWGSQQALQLRPPSVVVPRCTTRPQNTRRVVGYGIEQRVGVWQIWAGNPAKFLRKLTGKETAFITTSASNYAALAQTHLAENSKDWQQVVEEKVRAPPSLHL